MLVLLIFESGVSVVSERSLQLFVLDHLNWHEGFCWCDSFLQMSWLMLEMVPVVWGPEVAVVGAGNVLKWEKLWPGRGKCKRPAEVRHGHLKHFCFDGLTGYVSTLKGLSIIWLVQDWVRAPTSRLNWAIFAFRLLKILLSRCWLPEIWVILEKAGFYIWLCSKCKALLVAMLYFQSGPVDRLYWTKLCPLHQTSRVFVSPKPQCLFLCSAALCALCGCCIGHWITLFTMWGGHGRSSSWSFTNVDKCLSTCLSCHDAQPASSAEKSLMRRQLVSNSWSVVTHWLYFCGWILPLLLQVLSLDAAAMFVLEDCSWKKF